MFRLSARADPAFLAEMLYEAVNWFDDGAEERPPLDVVLARPENARYIAGWGRTGDVALCALDRRDEPVGAAWYRHFSAAEPGYGYVADDIPELAIGGLSRVPQPARRQLAPRRAARGERAGTASGRSA